MPNLQDVRENYNPQKAYQYEVSLIGNAVTGSQEILTERVANTTLPGYSNDVFFINYKSGKTPYAGRDSSAQSFSVTYNEDAALSVYSFHKNWRENGINNSTTGGGLSKDLYSIDAVITTLQDDGETVTSTHRMTRIFPSDIEDVNLSYDDSAAMQVTITYSFERHLFTGGEEI